MMNKINKKYSIWLVFSVILGFLAGMFAETSVRSKRTSENNKWSPEISEIGKWAATLSLNDEIQLVVAATPHAPEEPINSVAYRHNRTILLQHHDKDRDGEFEQLQFNDPVTGQMHLFFLDRLSVYRNATDGERDKRLKEIESAPGK